MNAADGSAPDKTDERSDTKYAAYARNVKAWRGA